MTEPDGVLGGVLVPLVVLVGDVDGIEPIVVPPNACAPVVPAVVGGVLAIFGGNICLDGPVLNGVGPRVLVVGSCGCAAVTGGDVPVETVGCALVITFCDVPAVGCVLAVTFCDVLAIGCLVDGALEETVAVTFGIPVSSTPASGSCLSS